MPAAVGAGAPGLQLQPAAAATGVAVASTTLCAVHGPALTRYGSEQLAVRYVERDDKKVSKDMLLLRMG